MSRVVLNVSDRDFRDLEDKSVMVYNRIRNEWVAMNKKAFLLEVDKEFKELRKELETQKEDVKNLKENLNKKLEELYNVLQVLTKGSE